MKIKRNNKQGISLIVLVISVIVMIILAGAIIISINNTGVLSSADKAKLDTEIANEKEILNFCVVNAKVKDENRELKLDKLNEELVSYSAQAYMEVDTIIVQFNKSGRYYEIYANGKAEHVQASGLKTLTIECKTSGGTILDTKEYIIIKDKYSIELPVIEGYEPIDMVATGTITESTTVEIPYYVIFDDDTELVFTGLDSSGNITTVENDIVSYMVGDGTTTDGNGLKDKINQGILKIPDVYKEKPVVKIGLMAFIKCTSIKKVILSNDITTLEEDAFKYCAGIEKLILGKKLKSLAYEAFENCTSLKEVMVNTETNAVLFNQFIGCSNFTKIIVSENNPTYKAIDNILYSKDGKTLYLVPTGIAREIVIPSEVETIGVRAFAYGKLNKVVIPEGVVTIKDHAFYSCHGIKEVLIPDTVKTIEADAFKYCSGMERLVLGKMLNSIGGEAFEGCTNLKTVIINTETAGVGFNRFEGCTNFTEIIVSNNNPTYKVVDNILYSNTTLCLVPIGRTGEVIIPERVETIQTDAFSYNFISKVIISKNVETIKQRAFCRCWGIKEILIGSAIKTIEVEAFKYCSSLKTITIDSTTIAKSLTSQTSCGQLINAATTIYIKEGITEIGSYVVDNFDVADTDKPGYVKYVKKAVE